MKKRLTLSVSGPLTRLGGGGAGDEVQQVAGGGHHGPGRLGSHLGSLLLQHVASIVHRHGRNFKKM